MSRALTSATTLNQLKREAKQWLKALRTGDPEARARLLRAHPGAPPDAGLRHVQHALAREFGFASWARLKAVAPATGAAAPDAAHDADAGESTLHGILAAADAGDVVRLTALLDAHPELVSERGTLPGHTGLRTALHFGVAHEPVVRLLLERGADANVRDEGDNAYPLHFAAENQDLPVIRLLLEHGADPIGTGDDHELEVIGWATCWDYVTVQPDVLAFLLAHGARHQLFSATAVGDVDAVRAAAAADPASLARVMDRTNRRRTALHLAVVKRQPAALRALLALGADPEAHDQSGLTALDQAALAGEQALSDILIAHGAAVGLPAAVALGRAADLDRLLAADPGCLAPGARWGTLIVRAAERAPGHVIETLVAMARRSTRSTIRRRPSTASRATPRSTPPRGTATPAPPTRCCVSAPAPACATASTARRPLAGPTSPAIATPARASSRPTSTCSTPSPAARRRGSPRSSTPFGGPGPAAGRYGGTPDEAAVTPLAWAGRAGQGRDGGPAEGTGRQSADDPQ